MGCGCYGVWGLGLRVLGFAVEASWFRVECPDLLLRASKP